MSRGPGWLPGLMTRSRWSRAGSSAGRSGSLAEHAGEATPDGMQRLFTTARGDTGGVRDDVRGYVAAALASPDGVLIGDGTGFEKGGSLSAGVQRQYTGTAGKITNCQLGVFLAYASPKGRALVDRELYLPRSWTGDGQRLAAAGVPEGTRFRTKPQLLEMMIERAVAAGIPFGWVTADEVLPGCQERSRDGPLPGQALRELVPLRYPRHARPCLPYRHPGHSRRRRRGPGQLGQRDPPHGATTTKNAPAAATTSDNDCKCRERFT